MAPFRYILCCKRFYCNIEDKYYFKLLNNKILVGLNAYLDTIRHPAANASYITKAGNYDCFYDDNVWIGLYFTDLYMKTSKKGYGIKAKIIWKFIESGIGNSLDGGLYWCEQKKNLKIHVPTHLQVFMTIFC